MGRLIHYVITAVALCPWPAAAGARTVALTPAAAQVAFCPYRLGMNVRSLLAGPESRIRFTAALTVGMFAAP